MLDYIIIFEFDFFRLILKVITSFLYTHIHIHTGGMYAHVTVKRDGLSLKTVDSLYEYIAKSLQKILKMKE